VSLASVVQLYEISMLTASLKIPFEHHHLIARAAPQTSDQARSTHDQLDNLKSTWGYRKRVARDMRVKRKEFW
jgi:hypothetical protein